MNKGRTFIKFCIVGASNTMIDFLVFTLLVFGGMPAVLSQVISYSCGLFNSYILNRKWTFKQSSKAQRSELFRFVLINMLTLLITMKCLLLFSEQLGWFLLISKGGATIIGLGINFIGTKAWVFTAQNG